MNVQVLSSTGTINSKICGIYRDFFIDNENKTKKENSTTVL